MIKFIWKRKAGFTVTKIKINTVGMVEKIDEPNSSMLKQQNNCQFHLKGVEMVLIQLCKDNFNSN
jgi:hypothetical protein